MKKLHIWVQSKYVPGHKQHRCAFCGATRDNFRFGMKVASKYGPWMLNGKPQKYCPPREEK